MPSPNRKYVNLVFNADMFSSVEKIQNKYELRSPGEVVNRAIDLFVENGMPELPEVGKDVYGVNFVAYVPDKTYEKIKKTAKKRGVAMRELVRGIFELYGRALWKG